MSSSSPPRADGSNQGYRRILRSTSIIGGASIANVFIGVLRLKVAAVLLGPSGVGLIGLLQSVMTTAAGVASLGFGTVGTRQIAEAATLEDVRHLDEARRALFWGSLALAVTGGVLVWALRGLLAQKVMGNPSLSESIGWLGIAVALTVASGSQGALLNGLRRIGDMARVTLASAIVAALLGIAALLIWGENGVVAFVVAAPMASFIVGHWYVAKLPPVRSGITPIRVLASHWKTLARLGTSFMITGLVGSVGHLAVRTLIQRDLGVNALGQFQASWVIAMTYIGFVLGAMGADFYPRLVATMHDHAAAKKVVNEQTEVALLLAGPVLLAVLATAPWVLELLYSTEFREAAIVLRWQVLADVLKVASWPLSYTLLASGGGRTYLLAESLATAVFVGVIWVGLPLLGLRATGLAVTCMYVFYLPLVYALARRSIGFSWESGVRRHGFMLVLGAVTIFALGQVSDALAAIFGLPAAMVFGLFSINRLAQMSDVGAITRVAESGRSLLRRLGLWRD